VRRLSSTFVHLDVSEFLTNMPPLTEPDLDYATLDEIREAALAKLDVTVRDFLEGGAGDEITLRRNRAAFEDCLLKPRVMSGSLAPTTTTTFLGVDLALPILTAPFGADGLFDVEGQIAVARANQTAGIASIAPEAGTHSFEAIAEAAPAAAGFAQLHPMGPPDNFLRMIARFERAGYRGLCVTCDCPTRGWRERNLHNRFNLSTSFLDGNYPAASGDTLRDVFGQLYERGEPVWSWNQLGELLGHTSLPWIAKGIITTDDAIAAAEAGASAVLVSNHGGRQLDGVPAAIEALPSIVDAVGDRVQIAIDSGIRRGADVVKALALGADVAVIGRLAVYGLVVGGEHGVRRVLDLLHSEITTILTLLGRNSVDELDRTSLTAWRTL
jgi:isopentenyl diphosphate isomerase/L-lactate dehydrogenase-like FMN-dependent dehydrogenase